MGKIFKWLGLALAATLALAVIWLTVAPPALIRVATNYSAKIVCSNVFLANRKSDEVMAVDVQAAGHPILGFISTSVDRPSGEVRSRLLGLFALGRAVHRSGLGCASVPNGDSRPSLTSLTIEPKQPKPLTAAPVEALDVILKDETLIGSGWRAIVVLQDGKLVAERYAPGFDKDTPLLGWSMAKTITGALVGVMEKDGLTNRNAKELFPQWAQDKRADITVADMLGMASSLKWNEGYGAVSDVTRMLYLENDMAEFVVEKNLQPNTGAKIGGFFNYSSGTSVALSAYLQSRFPTPQEGVAYLHNRLFNPLGMTSAVVETDAAGTFVGGSYIYASARDWGRFGKFLLDGGKAGDNLLVPFDFVTWMTTPHGATEKRAANEGEANYQPFEPGAYGQGHLWMKPPNRKYNKTGTPFAYNAWWLAGHDGQAVAIVPRHNIVVVRMGLTPSKLEYRPAPLVTRIIETLNP